MAWQVKAQHLDKRLGMVIVHLHEPESGAEHRLQICVGADSCPLCGHVHIKTNLGQVDARAILARELEQLQADHAQQEAYARKFNIQVRKKAK